MAREDQLLTAAAAAFARRGFHATTVPEIAAEAGVSVGLLYRYFDGKRGLALALVERYRVEALASLDVLTRGDDPAAALGALVDGRIEEALRDRHGSRLLLEIGAEAARDDAVGAAVRAADAAVREAIAGLVLRARPGADAGSIAALALVALDGLACQCAIDPDFDPVPVAAIVRSLLQPGAA